MCTIIVVFILNTCYNILINSEEIFLLKLKYESALIDEFYEESIVTIKTSSPIVARRTVIIHNKDHSKGFLLKTGKNYKPQTLLDMITDLMED